MISLIKKNIQSIFKFVGYAIYKIIYGKINNYELSEKHSKVKIEEVIIKNENIKYKLYRNFDARLYTDTIHNTAIIIENKLIEGPSFQIKNNNFVDIHENIVLKKGTPRLIRNIDGKILSLLTGGAGNNNYWHWLFDVIPRIHLLKQKYSLDEIDFFLVPSIAEKYQIETLINLNIPLKKIISSQNYRHIRASEIIATDHPYVLDKNSTKGIQNIPIWILEWLSSTFKKKIKVIPLDMPKKIYIDRSDSKSNNKNLRKITNEKIVKELFLKAGYKILRLSEFDFLDQVKLFYNADKICGLHGGGFANLVFCKKNTNILELRPSSSGNTISNLAKKIGLNYNEISVVPHLHNQNNQNGHIEVPIDKLKEKIILL